MIAARFPFFMMSYQPIWVHIKPHLLLVTVIAESIAIFFLLSLMTILLVRRIARLFKNRRKKGISFDVQAFAGEDPITTQLDLVRAYLEMDKKDAAKEVLQSVIRHGSPSQKDEATRLIAQL